MTTTQRIWNKDFANITGQLASMGAVRTLDDGFQFIDETIAPSTLTNAYRGLRSAGYAKGWL